MIVTTLNRNKQFLQEVPAAHYCSNFYSKSLKRTCKWRLCWGLRHHAYLHCSCIKQARRNLTIPNSYSYSRTAKQIKNKTGTVELPCRNSVPWFTWRLWHLFIGLYSETVVGVEKGSVEIRQNETSVRSKSGKAILLWCELSYSCDGTHNIGYTAAHRYLRSIIASQ
jgi:hypothetical protein